MRRLIIISEPEQINLLKPILSNSILIAMNKETETALKNLNLEFKSINDYFLIRRDYEFVLKSKKFIQDWIKNNKIFNDKLTHRNLHLFDILEYGMCCPSEYFSSIADIIKILDISKSILTKEKPDQVIVVNDNDLLTKSIKLLTKPTLVKSNNKIQGYTNLLPKIAKVLFKLRLYNGKIRSLLKKPNPKGKILIFAAGSNYILPILPLIKTRKDDFIIIKPLQFLPNNINELLKKENLHYIPIENFLDSTLIKEINHYNKKLTNNLKSLFLDQGFTSSFIYKNTKIFDILRPTFDYLLIKRGRILESIANIELCKKILEQTKPKLIIVVEEENLPSKIILKLAKQYNIPTLLMQHGFISRLYAKGHYAKGHILSDKVAVWGKNFKQYLVQYNKSKRNDIHITGKLVDKNYNRDITLKKLNIPSNKKIVMLATNKVSDAENKELILATLKATKNMNDVQLIIKLHPMETGKLQKKLAKLTKTNPIIVKNIDINEVINISNVVITFYSTVGLDALAQTKPLISVNFTEKVDELDYVKSGSALGVYHPKDLENAIKLLLYNKELKEKLQLKAKAYAANHISYDGKKALQKTLNLIDGIINKC